MLPLFVTCLFAGILITNLVPANFSKWSGVIWPTRTPAVALIADISLGAFLAMSLMSMQLWTLIDLAGPIFTFGAIEGQVGSAEAQYRAALAGYQQTVLGAFRETNDALTGSQKRIQEFETQRVRVDALREFARLSKLRFDKGVSGYLEVLVAENELFAAEIASVNLQAARYTQLINVYQAVGGGWVDIADQMTPQPQGLKTASTQ